jgi:hypothetical protein
VNQHVHPPQKGLGPLSSKLDDPASIPYFLWDEPMTVEELRRRIRDGSHAERIRLVGKLLREARDSEVWLFTTPDFVAKNWRAISFHMGRSRGFWSFLFRAWSDQGRVDVEWAG